LKLAFEYHRATDDWGATLQILRWAQNVARGRAMLQSVRENVLGVEYVMAHGTNVQVRYRKWGFDG
jgi:hypothetical protein